MLLALLGAAGYGAYERVESPESTFFGRCVTGVAPGRHIVALTYDDGPSDVTPAILDVLRAQHVRATFFVVGQAAAAHPDLLRRMRDDGDAIGDHSWSHAHLNIRSTAGVEADLARTDAAIAAATGTVPVLVRPPFGARSFAVMAAIARRGQRCVLWRTPLANDWEQPGAPVIARRILRAVRDGDVLVLHDGDRGRERAARAQDVAATQAIVEGLRARGFRLVTVPEMLDEAGT